MMWGFMFYFTELNELVIEFYWMDHFDSDGSESDGPFKPLTKVLSLYTLKRKKRDLRIFYKLRGIPKVVVPRE
jgi:hypothetical protein